MRNDPLPRISFLLFSINAQLIAVQSNLDLAGAYARQFDADTNRVSCLTNVNRRHPRTGHYRHLFVSRFLQHRKQPSDPFRQTLEFDPLETRWSYILDHLIFLASPTAMPPA